MSFYVYSTSVYIYIYVYLEMPCLCMLPSLKVIQVPDILASPCVLGKLGAILYSYDIRSQLR